MAVRVAINGFGRIGRLVLRCIIETGRKDLQVVAINDLGPPETNAHLLRYDSVHGRFPGEVKVSGDRMIVHGHDLKVTAIKDPAQLPHKELGVDIALECTGIFTTKEKASAHLAAGAKRVLISAPADGVDLTVVYGVNHQKLTREHIVVSNASCTTNCLAPVAKVLHDAIGIEHGFMTTVHSYTNDQPSLDQMHKDLYRARAAALSMIPTSTGAAKAVGLVLPELKGKLDGVSIRVPTPNVSVIDFKIVTKRKTSVEEVNETMKRAAREEMKGILDIVEAPLVSSDFNHNPFSSSFALDQTKVMDGSLVRVMSWYDNEWGFSNRMADTAVAMANSSKAMYRTLDDLGNVKGKIVLVRLDLNVPMKNGKVTDTTRIERQAPTVQELSERGARVVLLSHFDRPGGKPVPSMSLKPVALPVGIVIGRPVAFAADCIGPVAEEAIAKLKDGDVLLLENTRFHAGEEKNDPEFTRALAKLGNVYVNDAFSAAHRAHASTEGLAHLLPSAAGRSMEAELSHLSKALEHPQHPVMAVVGGAKISTKIALLENLLARVDVLVIGGAMANTFLAAEGRPIGRSLAEPDQFDTARRIMAKAQSANVTILLPTDVVVAGEFKANSPSRIVGFNDVDENEMILDVGPRTIQAFGRLLDKTKTLVWNGPLGAFEIAPFDRGTNAAAKAVAERTREGGLLSVAGGGDTVAALAHAEVLEEFSYVSTAGGAFLEWLEGRTLPGVAALKRPE